MFGVKMDIFFRKTSFRSATIFSVLPQTRRQVSATGIDRLETMRQFISDHVLVCLKGVRECLSCCSVSFSTSFHLVPLNDPNDYRCLRYLYNAGHSLAPIADNWLASSPDDDD